MDAELKPLEDADPEVAEAIRKWIAENRPRDASGQGSKGDEGGK